MIDFTSSLYLGMKHSNNELNGWEQLTTGVPAILGEPAASRQAGSLVARMQDLEAGVAAPSTLHLYTDLFEWLKKKHIILFIDEQIYPVSRFGIEKLFAAGIQVQPFRHFDAADLDHLIKNEISGSLVPVVMTDGWCPLCGKAAPLRDYLNSVKRLGGHVIIDDTQAFGIFGEGKNRTIPYGTGGGGLLKGLCIKDDSIITVVSLAKSFGVPMAILGGSSLFINAFKEASKTRVHSSPVSMAHVQAALHALHINYYHGDQLRKKLWQNLCVAGNEFNKKGIGIRGGIFPVQHICCSTPRETIQLHERLMKNNICTALISLHDKRRPAIAIVLRCDHTIAEIMNLVDTVAKQTQYASYCKIQKAPHK